MKAYQANGYPVEFHYDILEKSFIIRYLGDPATIKIIDFHEVSDIVLYGHCIDFVYKTQKNPLKIEYKNSFMASEAHKYFIRGMTRRQLLIHDIICFNDFSEEVLLDKSNNVNHY